MNVHVPKDKLTQMHMGFGFVEFKGEEDAQRAIKVLNMVKMFGKPIRVNQAARDQQVLEVGANIFVGNLDAEVDEKLLYDTFSAFGVIVTTPKIMRDGETGNSRGFGFVSFESFEASDAAIEAMNGQFLCNRPVSCTYAIKKDSKGERHGSAAERLLAANNPLKSDARPNQFFGMGPAGAMGAPPPMGAGAMPPPPPASAAAAAGGCRRPRARCRRRPGDAAAARSMPPPPTGMPPPPGHAPPPGCRRRHAPPPPGFAPPGMPPPPGFAPPGMPPPPYGMPPPPGFAPPPGCSPPGFGPPPGMPPRPASRRPARSRRRPPTSRRRRRRTSRRRRRRPTSRRRRRPAELCCRAVRRPRGELPLSQ